LSRKKLIFVVVPIVVLGTILLCDYDNRAVAAPRTIQDCEKIGAADAYNQCLASFGPAAREHVLKSVAPRNADHPRSLGSFGGARRRHGMRAAHTPLNRSQGRQRMEFTISPRRSR
jgi:hypothetical protein